jgi:outer membrane protein
MKLGPFRIVSAALFAVGVWSLSPATSRAQTLQEELLEQQGLAQEPTLGKWSVTLGAGVAEVPDYPGGDRYRVRPVPLVSIEYDKLVFLGPYGLGLNAIQWNGLRAGPVLGFEGGRKQDDDPHLNGLGDISPSLTGGVFATYRFSSFQVSGTVRQAITHTENGLTGLLQFDYRGRIADRFELIAGPDVEFADGAYDRTWFGVSPGQSAQSGLPVFSPGGGVKDAGLHAILTYYYTQHVLLRGFAGVKELTGDIAGSPIVQSKTQGLVGLGAAYHF